MKADRRATVAVWCRLADHQYQTKVMPLLESSHVGRVILFRRFPPAPHDKVHCLAPPGVIRWSAALSMGWMLTATVWTAIRARFGWGGRLDFAFGVTAFPHGMLARLAGLIAGARSGVWWIGTDLYAQFSRPMLRPIYTAVLRGCDLTLTMGSRSTTMLIAHGWKPERAFAMMNAHDLNRFQPEERPRQWDIINVGRHDRDHKRLHLLLEAVALARRAKPDLMCALVGDGPDRRRLERASRRLGLDDCVRFLGRRADVPDLLNQSRVFAMCSAWEGLPAAMVEAIACGLPVVTNDVSDISDLARHGENALVVTQDDPADYAKAMLSLLTDDALWRRLHEGALRTRRELQTADPRTQAIAFWDRCFASWLGEHETQPGSARHADE